MKTPPPIEVADRQKRYEALPARLAALAHFVLLAEKRTGRTGLSIALVDDREIARLHGEFLDDPTPTDVMSFPLEDDADGLLGEVVVSTDTAAREAKKRGLTFDREVLLYVVHGILHLLGYDDHAAEDRKKMHARQEELLERFLALEAEHPAPGTAGGSRRTRAPAAKPRARARAPGKGRRGGGTRRGRS
jgi:probable rRNA maturation factor